MSKNQKLLRVIINGTAWFLPFLSARLSYGVWTKTHRHKMPKKESSVFFHAVKQKIVVGNMKVMTYRWGELSHERPVVLLLHGWNGRGTQLNVFVDELLLANFDVVSFDAYGHGLSDGQHTNVLQSVKIIENLSQHYGGFFAMIGHSFGAMCAVNAIAQGSVCKKLITISAPTEFSALLYRFSHYMGLSEKASLVLKAYILHKYSITSFDEISITGLAPKMKIPLLIIHDKNDEQVPLSQGEKVVTMWGRLWQKTDQLEDGSTDVKLHAKLYITENLGHVRILRDTQVLAESLKFLLNKD